MDRTAVPMRNTTRFGLPWLVVFVVQSPTAASAGAGATNVPVEVAQLGNLGPGSPSYGYEPYNDRNPTGFYHPNGMGYGTYHMTQKYHGHRIRALQYRKFRGY